MVAFATIIASACPNPSAAAAAAPSAAAAWTSVAAPFVVLRNAAEPDTFMPVAGLGTDFSFCENATASGNQSFAPALQWLQLGGRRFDGALSYGCDAGVGAAVRASGVNRSDVFIVSKIGPGGLPYPLGFNETLSQAAQILAELNDTYVDLLLVHEPFSYWPDPSGAALSPSTDPACNLTDAQHYSERGCRLSTWRAMVEVFRAGKARSIGVSNYNSSHIDEIAAAGLPLPAVNQLQFSPHHGPVFAPCTCGHSTSRPTPLCGTSTAEVRENCSALFAYLRARDIVVNGYSPFEGKADGASLLAEPALLAIAADHNVSASQVVLNWQWRHGVVVNPTATTSEYQLLNLNFDSFQLTEAEAAQLDAWPQNPLPNATAAAATAGITSDGNSGPSYSDTR